MVNQVGQFISKYRQSQDLSQGQLGRMLGVTGQYISNAECGRNEKAVGLCLRLMKILPAGKKKELSEAVSTVMENYFEEKLKRASKRKG